MNSSNSSTMQKTAKAIVYSLAIVIVVVLPTIYYMKSHGFSEVSQGIAAFSLGLVSGLIGALLSL